MADKYQSEISKMLHNYNIFTRHEKAIPYVSKKTVKGWYTDDRATPDLTGGLVHMINVEVKTGKNEVFRFDSWTEAQQKYAEEWRIKRGCEYWLAVIVETAYSRNNVKRAAFFVPFPVMAKTMKTFEGIQKCIPYRAVKGMNREVQDRVLSMERLWLPFELSWIPGRGWDLPEGHAFSRMYLNQEPYLYEE